MTTHEHDETNETCHLNQDRSGMLDLGCTCQWTEEDDRRLRQLTD